MAIVINGSGTVTGISVGGLPDAIVDAGTLASGINKTSISDSGNATAITINDRENVGIGVSPKSWNNNMEALQLSSAAAFVGSTGGNGESARMYQNFYNSGAAELYIQDGYACQYSQSSDNGTHTFSTAASGSADGTVTWTTVMKIDNSGDVMMSGATSSGGIGLTIDKDYPSITSNTSTASLTRYSFQYNSTQIGSITTTSSTTAYNTSSDYRLKENVVPMTGSIDRLKELNPSRFNFVADADKTVDGFLAHEAQEVVPEAISGEKDAMTTEEYEVEPAVLDDDGRVVTEAVMGEREVIDAQGIDQSKLVPLLTGALQEAVAKIEELTTRIETLENA